MDYKEMNDAERAELCEKVKNKMRELFDWFESSTYLDLMNMSNLETKEQLDTIDVVKLVSYVLNASQKPVKVECVFNNEFLDGDNRSGKFFVWGSSGIDKDFESLENVISMKPSSSFTYEWEEDSSDDPEEYSKDMISHLEIGDVNMYRGTFSYMGVVNEDRSGVWASLEAMKLFNEVQIRYIEDDAPAWKKHIAASYRMYDGKSYKLAFLTAFIALDSLIEYLTDTIKDIYYLHVNGTIDFSLKNYNKTCWNAIDIMREEVLRSEAYDRLIRLENPNRNLIGQKMVTILKFTHEWTNSTCEKYVGKYSFFEKIRNSLAHGNDCKKNDIVSDSCFPLYKDDLTQDIDFDRLYVDLILSICKFIETLRS